MPLLLGEQPIAQAPKVTLTNGSHCIPQHYLTYNHSLASVEAIVLHMEFDPRFPVFVAQDDGGLYVQVGIIGPDNYDRGTHIKSDKIVYGRKWRVEPQLPSSEIIQTVFLALKTAREHELRELFQLRYGEHVTTPFSCHRDLPLMAHHQELVQQSSVGLLNASAEASIADLLGHVNYGGYRFEIDSVMQLDDTEWYIKIRVSGTGHAELSELKNRTVSLLVSSLDSNHLLHAVMNKLIDMSNHLVAQTLTFKGMALFSAKNDVGAIAEMSIEGRLRSLNVAGDMFQHSLAETNYATDQTRVPKMVSGALSERIGKTLKAFDRLEGILPELG